MPVETRLQAKKKQELFDKLGEEIIKKDGIRYLGKGAVIADDIDWRSFVLRSIEKLKCPYR